MGIHVFVFVNDFLVVGDTEEQTRIGGEMLEELLLEVGIQRAPHKRRGPVRALEFLGLFISNVPGHRGVGLTADRRKALTARLDSWLEVRPAAGANLQVDIHELARLLGHMVFASQVVPGGRTYMQACLAQFQGLEVLWDRGLVRPVGSCGPGDRLAVSGQFWTDLLWWRDHLESHCAKPLEEPAAATAVLSGTDASGWGTGQCISIDGAVEEHSLRFTRARG